MERRLLVGGAVCLSLLAGCTRAEIRRAERIAERSEEGRSGDDRQGMSDSSGSEGDGGDDHSGGSGDGGSDSGGDGTGARLVVAEFYADADGDDRPNEEYATLENAAGETMLERTYP